MLFLSLRRAKAGITLNGFAASDTHAMNMESDLKQRVMDYIQTNSVKVVAKAPAAPKQANQPKQANKEKAAKKEAEKKESAKEPVAADVSASAESTLKEKKVNFVLFVLMVRSRM